MAALAPPTNDAVAVTISPEAAKLGEAKAEAVAVRDAFKVRLLQRVLELCPGI